MTGSDLSCNSPRPEDILSSGLLFQRATGANPMARRRYQRGQLKQRGTRNPVWVGRWREDRIVDGQLKRVQRTVVLGTVRDLPTRKLAMRTLEAAIADTGINSLDYRPKHQITFGELATQWKKLILPNHKPSTQNSCRSHLKHHLEPWFGNILLSDFSTMMLQKWIASLTTSPKTIRNLTATLRMLWQSAKHWGLVTGNPFEDLRLPKLGVPNRRVFSEDEIKRILDAAPEPHRSIFWLAAETGMRIGEILGLRWCDIGEGRVSVRQNVWGGKVSTPKTRTGFRAFAVSDPLCAHLGSLRAGRGPDDVSFVFCTRTGNALDQRYVVRGLQDVLAKLDIPPAGMHAFRHANATLMIANGIDPKTAAARLGHSDPSITLGIYSHVVRSQDRAAAELFGRILCPDVTKSTEPPAEVVVAQPDPSNTCAQLSGA